MCEKNNKLFEMSSGRVHIGLQKCLRKFSTALVTGFRGSSFEIFCSVVRVSALATSEFEVCLPVKLYHC